MRRLMIGTRGSALAMWQARRVAELLREAHAGIEVELEVIRTRGDVLLSRPLHAIPGKGLFTREIEQALLDGRIDLAVHSLKDLPTDPPAGLVVTAVPPREDPADVLVARPGLTLATLPAGAAVFTSSLRRKAQLLAARPDLEIRSIRGNVDTRLKKFDASDAAGVVFAAAGLIRLGLADRITERLDPAAFLPACGQGAMAVEIAADNAEAASLLAAVDDADARLTTTAERAFLAELGGGCHTPAGAWARRDEDGTLALTAMIASEDGAARDVRSTSTPLGSDPLADADALGRRIARRLGGAEGPTS